MRAFIVVIIFLLCGAENVYSQKSQSFLLGISGGASFSTGKLGSKSVSDNSAGWAQTGIGVHLSGTYQLTKTFGISAVVGYTKNKEDKEAVRQSLLKETSSAYSQIDAHTGNWQMLSLLAGPALRLPLSPSAKAVFTAKATAGVCKTYVPGYHYAAIIGNSSGGVTGAESASTTHQSLPFTFSYSIQPGLAFQLTKGIYLTGTVSYSGTAKQSYYAPYPTPVFIVGNTSPGQPQIVYADKQQSSMTLLTAEVGIEVGL